MDESIMIYFDYFFSINRSCFCPNYIMFGGEEGQSDNTFLLGGLRLDFPDKGCE